MFELGQETAFRVCSIPGFETSNKAIFREDKHYINMCAYKHYVLFSLVLFQTYFYGNLLETNFSSISHPKCAGFPELLTCFLFGASHLIKGFVIFISLPLKRPAVGSGH
jgi:hypothetical protein